MLYVCKTQQKLCVAAIVLFYARRHGRGPSDKRFAGYEHGFTNTPMFTPECMARVVERTVGDVGLVLNPLSLSAYGPAMEGRYNLPMHCTSCV